MRLAAKKKKGNQLKSKEGIVDPNQSPEMNQEKHSKLRRSFGK
jgi:hypothetical protein